MRSAVGRSCGEGRDFLGRVIQGAGAEGAEVEILFVLDDAQNALPAMDAMPGVAPQNESGDDESHADEKNDHGPVFDVMIAPANKSHDTSRDNETSPAAAGLEELLSCRQTGGA